MALYKQRSLRSYLSSNNSLTYLENTQKILRCQLRQFINNKASDHVLDLEDPVVYSGYIDDCILFKRKYFLSPNKDFLAEGLTHSDYSILWPGLDDHGYGKGKDIVDNNLDISINLDSQTTYIDQPSFWIGGDTIVKPNYAHWMFEHLLKFEIFARIYPTLDIPFIVSDRVPSSFLYWAELLMGRKLNIRKIDTSLNYQFKKLYVSSCPAYRRKGDCIPAIWRGGFSTLRSRLTSVAENYKDIFSTDSNSDVLFLSRSSASWRKAVNESEIAHLAKEQLGAQVINISDFTPLEQINLLQNARVLILFGGADGFACNFLPKSCKVLEILAPGHTALFTSKIFCAIHGIYYNRIHGTKFITDQTGPHPLDRDYLVSIEEVNQAFKTHMTSNSFIRSLDSLSMNQLVDFTDNFQIPILSRMHYHSASPNSSQPLSWGSS